MDRFYRKNRNRFCNQNRIAIDPDWFLIAIMIAIAVLKSGSDCEMKIEIDFEIKIADRFSHENRDPISRSVCTCGPETVFNRDRFQDENR